MFICTSKDQDLARYNRQHNVKTMFFCIWCCAVKKHWTVMKLKVYVFQNVLMVEKYECRQATTLLFRKISVVTFRADMSRFNLLSSCYMLFKKINSWNSGSQAPVVACLIIIKKYYVLIWVERTNMFSI